MGSPCSRSASTRGYRSRRRRPSRCPAGGLSSRPTWPPAAGRAHRAAATSGTARVGGTVKRVRVIAAHVAGAHLPDPDACPRYRRDAVGHEQPGATGGSDRRGGATRREDLARDGVSPPRGRVREPPRARGADHRPPGRHRPGNAAGQPGARWAAPARGRIGRILSHQPMAPEVIADAVRWCFANGLNPHINTIERMIVQGTTPTSPTAPRISGARPRP